MRPARAIVAFLAVVGLGAMVVAGVHLWKNRPWRVAVSVNGHPLVWSELELRTRTLVDDARRIGELPKAVGNGGRYDEAVMQGYRRRTAKMWIVKEVMLGEALARGCEVTAEDEKNAMKQMTRQLKSRGMTPEQFFREGPMPENLKRRDFRESMVIDKFTKKEFGEKVRPTTEEIDARHAELRERARKAREAGSRERINAGRKAAMDSLAAERYRGEFRRFFRSAFSKADVKCPEFPELEEIAVVSPSRPEDADTEVGGK